MNGDLYLATRMIFSLSRGRYVPAGWGRVTRRRRPRPALLGSTAGLVVATIVAIPYPSRAYVYLFGIALFGGLFVEVVIFMTHLFFRRAWKARGGRRSPVRMVGYPYTAVPGGVLGTQIIATTWWAPAMRPTDLIWKREKVVQPAALPVQTSGK